MWWWWLGRWGWGLGGGVAVFLVTAHLVNFTMLLPIVEIGAEAGPVALLQKS